MLACVSSFIIIIKFLRDIKPSIYLLTFKHVRQTQPPSILDICILRNGFKCTNHDGYYTVTQCGSVDNLNFEI